jgi:hypothetical protein
VTVAVALLVLATLVVLAALPTQSAGWLSVSSVLALVCGALAARIVHSELLQSRREAAADRAAQAKAYRTMFSERAEEHAEFTTAMTDRLLRSEREVRELEGTLVLAEKRAIEAETRVKRESRRANDALDLVAELKEALEIKAAQEADELAIWDADVPTVVDLLAWDEKVNVSAQGPLRAQNKHA